jgi:hypothetical protein
MRHVSRHRLTGLALALLLVGGSLFVLSLRAQSPGPTPPAQAVPLPGRDGPTPPDTGQVPVPGDVPGLPTPRQGPTGIQRQGDLLRLARNAPGDAKPIVIEAEEIHTWTDGGKYVFLLQGQVLVQQSVVQVRCQQAVAWVQHGHQNNGILHMDLYAEGQVRLDNSVEVQDGQKAVLDLNTRGEFRFRGGRGKVHKQQRQGEPVVARAQALGLGARRTPVVPA